jgi:RNA polymerase sigma-70 factor (ECF subfamily)
MQSEEEFIQALQTNQNIIHKVCTMYSNPGPEREDLFQDIVLAAWKGYSNFKGMAKFSTWLYRVALNTAISFYRKESRQPATTPLDEAVYWWADNTTSTDEKLKAMHQAIAGLSRIDKALVMLYLDDYDYAAMGEIMGITANNVAVKMNRIKAKLKEQTRQYL